MSEVPLYMQDLIVLGGGSGVGVHGLGFGGGG